MQKKKKGKGRWKWECCGTLLSLRLQSDILVCAIAWEWLEWKGTILEGENKEHYLWVCLQLMVYPTENVLSMLLDVGEKTFRKWAWIFLLALSDLECYVVSGRFA